MNISEIKELLELFGSLGIGALIGGVFVFFMIKSFLPSYFSNKAKNLATKEDIGAITNEVENVKSGYAEMLEEIKSDHQLKLASIEREKLLKKEVYLESAEALSKYHNSIAVLSNLNIDNQVISNVFSECSAKISKVTLVGTENTVKNLTRFTGEVGATFMNLMLERGALMNRKAHIDFLETIRSKHNEEIERCLTIMRNMNLEGIVDPLIWDRVNRSFENESSARDKVASEIDANWAVQNQEHLEFTNRCMECFFNVNELVPSILVSVRKELDLEINEEEFLNIHRENIRKARSTFDEFIEKIHEQVA